MVKRLQLRSVCGALLVLLTGAHCCGTEAKTPGSIHCYNAICHRVRTLSETAALVGRPLRLRASFYDHCSRDRHNTCGLTSSGEVFAATAADNAASPDLPDGTIVLIFNPATGQAAIARINNAGPYSPGRNLDVSRTLAGALGFERQGLAELDVIVLQAPAHADARYRHQRQYRTVAGFLGTFAARDEAIARANLALQHQDQPAPTSGATASAVDAIIAGLPLLVLAGAAPRVDADANAVHVGMADEAFRIGPAAPREELQNYFCPKAEGGLLSRKGAVDFSVAKGVAPGVFVVAEMRHPRVRERMSDLHLGPGPYYSFFRPYHLTSLEVPLSAAAAVIFGESHMQPLPVPSAEVGCVAKRNLKPGETLDAIGEYCYRGFALSRADALAKAALPLGLAQGAKVTKAIAKGELLTFTAVEPDASSRIYAARRAQDEMIAARR